LTPVHSERAGTRFVGRSAELAALQASPARLASLWGPGGIGKTTLALEFARRQPAHRRVVIAEAADATDADGVAAAVARGLDTRLGGADPVGRIGVLLGARPDTLLVLDNAEQATEAVRQTVSQWLDAASSLRILVTSRERLGLDGEHVVEVGPLLVPRRDEDSEATALLVDRVQRVAPGFALSDDNRGPVAALVRALEGIPLAIELAAGRFDILGVDGLLEAGLLDLGMSAAGGLPDRQRTLRRTLEWSWDLLDPAEQRALAWLSVFRDGFTAAAASQVLGAEALGLIGALRDRSLLWSRVDDRGRARLGLLDAVRSFADDQLRRRDEHGEAWAYHAQWALKAAEGWLAEGGASAVAKVEAERANLLAVVERALPNVAEGGPTAASDAFRGALALEPAMTARGPLASYHAMLGRVLAVAPGHPLEGPVRRARGRAAQLQGRTGDARPDLKAALEMAGARGDRQEAVNALTDLGVLSHQERRLDDARELYERALGQLEGLVGVSERWLLTRRGRLLGNLAAVHHDERRLDDARVAYDRALASIRRADDPRLEGIFLSNLALLDQEQGDLSAAEARLDAAVGLLSRQDRRLVGVAQGNLGAVLMEAGRLAEAETALQDAADVLATVGDERSLGLCEARLAALDALRGQTRQARQGADRARLRLAAIGDATALGAAEMALACAEMAEAVASVAQGKNADRLVEQARARVTANVDVAERSDDVRTLVRVMEAIAAGIATDRHALVVGDEAAWLRAPDGSVLDLSRRQTLRQIVQRLLRQRTEAPGIGLSLEDLREAGWPGEQMAPASAKNRVYVAVATLRKQGLGELLVRGDDGYRLDETVPLRSA